MKQIAGIFFHILSTHTSQEYIHEEKRLRADRARLRSTSHAHYASLDETTLGTANMADCMCVPQSGHFGGPLAV